MIKENIVPKITVVIVTRNRAVLLKKCLLALAAQTIPVDSIFIIDNASTDDTRSLLSTWLPQHLPKTQLIALNENTGGAGGFSKGLLAAFDSGAAWIWMMDDDASPHPIALEELVRIAIDPTNIYGSTAVNGSHTAWTITQLQPKRCTIDDLAALPEQAEVESLPFLGFMIHRSLVQKIGLPDAGFFIAADDVEYCLRARRAGAEVIIAGRSHIEHPRSQRQTKRIFGYNVVYLNLPSWKRYYDTRNRLLIARKYYGLRLLTETIPGSFVRLLAALYYEPRKGAQLWAWCCGMFDGLLGIKGKRHERWGIRQ